MFNWFKKGRSPEQELADKLLGPQALAIAIAETVRNYTDGVKAGQIQYPAHRREKSGVAQIWNDVRLEALHKMFGFGRADLLSLADIRRQTDLLNAFINDKPHLQLPQPSGETVADTWQAVWQVYVYLDAVGSELADVETDRTTLKAKGADIFDGFTKLATHLHAQWVAYDLTPDGVSPGPLPGTIIDILWADVTAKTKSIAISKVFGPSHEAGFKYVLNLFEKEGKPGDVEKMKTEFAKLRAAKQPEDIQQRR